MGGGIIFNQRLGRRKGCPTQRAAEKWDAPRFTGSFLASSFFCFQAASSPAHHYPQGASQTHTVSPFVPMMLIVLSEDLSIPMQSFPYVTDYVNAIFYEEKARFDYRFIRPIITIPYFFLRIVIVPVKFLFHRSAWGFEKRLIDSVLAFGIKYFASHEALELLIRHVQIEPLLYRYLLSGTPERKSGSIGEMLKGIDGDFSVNSIQDVVAHGLTIGHDDLSYEIFERFDKHAFLDNLDFYRNSRPEDIAQFGNKVLEENRKHSWQILGATNVVIIVVLTITIFADFHTSIRALNSFDSDSLLLWCLKHIYAEDKQAMIDLDFYLQTDSNRSHYTNDAFRSDPNQYLYYHIAFNEFAYELLRKNQQSLQRG